MSFAADTRCNCRLRKAVNFNERQGGADVDVLLLHYTGMEDGKSSENWLCVEESGVSCHYLIYENGEIVQMVAEADRAWHAGKSSWRGETDINSRSIGVEIVNPGHGENYADFPATQIESVIELSRDILSRHNIPARNVLGHSDVAPGRKIDPGEKFPWRELYQSGVGHWVEPATGTQGRELSFGDNGEEVAALQALLRFYGYGVEITGDFETVTRDCVYAFQQHFHQLRVDGVADGNMIATLEALIRTLGEE